MSEQPYLTEDVRRSIKAEAHTLWFDAFNPYIERLGLAPETDVAGDEAKTVREYVQQVMAPLLEDHQKAVKEVERLREALASRPRVLRGVETGPPEDAA